MCRLQKFWLRITYSLGLLLAASAVEAVPQVKLYSALGEPLLAEVSLNATESAATTVAVEGEGYRWTVLRQPQANTLLLLSEEQVQQPIVELALRIDGDVQPLVLLLNPVAPHSMAELLQQWSIQQQRLLQENERLREQIQQLEQQQHSGFTVLQENVLFRWLLFLLLGAGVALWIVRWWRSAEWVDLEKRTVTLEAEGGEHRFHQEVAQIEREIRRPNSVGSDS